MISLRIKFRSSSLPHKEGVIFYQLIQHRVSRQITTSYKLFQPEWNVENMIININTSQYQRREYLQRVEKRVMRDVSTLQKLIAENQSMETVIEHYEQWERKGSLFTFAERVAEELQNAGRRKTAASHRTALRSFSSFLNGENILLEAINHTLIKEYEQYLKSKQISLNTISFYMRILRAVYNRSVVAGVTEQCYPFKGVYVGIDKTDKRAVDVGVISRLKSANLLKSNNLAFARDLFLFSFYCRGMPFVDMAYLTHENVKDNHIVYQRQKTGQELNIRIEPCLRAIIARYPSENSRYLLPILSGDNPKYESALRLHNMRLKQISELLGLSTVLTSYVARHSWATLAKRKGVALQVISESMGHNNENTTRIYLSSLEKSVIDDVNAKLLLGV
ncbi:MAG: site-specific integrase [Alistipes sp.]